MLKIILSAFLFPLMISCAQTKSAKDTASEYKISLGQTITIDNTKITFLDVEEDSRCPINVRCLWMGRAILQFDIEGESKKIYFGETREGESKSLEVHANFMVDFLTPQVEAGKEIDKKDYLVTLKKKTF